MRSGLAVEVVHGRGADQGHDVLTLGGDPGAPTPA